MQPSPPGGRTKTPRPAFYTCPFVVMVDTREQRPWAFDNLHTNASDPGGRRPILVNTRRDTLPIGDYSILGHYPDFIIERKSKEDLYASVAKMANFKGRLAYMAEHATFAAVVVEADLFSVIHKPPAYSSFNPLALSRFITACEVRYPNVHWCLMAGREAAEAKAFRLMQFYWHDRHDNMNTGV